MEQALTPTAVRNLHLVSAEGAAPPVGSAAVEQQHRLLTQIWELAADVVIADVGNHDGDDSGCDLVDMFELGAMRLVVAAADTLSIRCANNVFREQVIREIEHVCGPIGAGARLAGALGSGDPKPMKELLAEIEGSTEVRSALEQALQAFGGRLVGNRIRNSSEADLIHAASRLIADYLGIAVPVVGILDSSVQLGATRVSGRPLLLGTGIDRNVRVFHTMAEQLMVDEADTEAARCVTRGQRPASDDGKSGATSVPPVSFNAEGAVLPASLGSYMRRHPRHPVDWHALFQSDGGRLTSVRVFEVSLTGASIEARPGLQVGEQGHLTFTQIEGQPQIPVTVMDARRPLGRAGLQFSGMEDACRRLESMAAGIRRQPGPRR